MTYACPTRPQTAYSPPRTTPPTACMTPGSRTTPPRRWKVHRPGRDPRLPARVGHRHRAHRRRPHQDRGRHAVECRARGAVLELVRARIAECLPVVRPRHPTLIGRLTARRRHHIHRRALRRRRLGPGRSPVVLQRPEQRIRRGQIEPAARLSRRPFQTVIRRRHRLVAVRPPHVPRHRPTTTPTTHPRSRSRNYPRPARPRSRRPSPRKAQETRNSRSRRRRVPSRQAAPPGPPADFPSACIRDLRRTAEHDRATGAGSAHIPAAAVAARPVPRERAADQFTDPDPEVATRSHRRCQLRCKGRRRRRPPVARGRAAGHGQSSRTLGGVLDRAAAALSAPEAAAAVAARPVARERAPVTVNDPESDAKVIAPDAGTRETAPPRRRPRGCPRTAVCHRQRPCEGFGGDRAPGVAEPFASVSPEIETVPAVTWKIRLAWPASIVSAAAPAR